MPLLQKQVSSSTWGISPALRLQLVNFGNLFGTSTLVIEFITKPLFCEPASQLQTYHSLTHAEDLCIVAQNASFDAEAVMGSDRSDSFYFVGRDCNPQTCAADK